MFIPLHVKSHFSPGEGVATIEELVDRAVALRLPALALTDVENLYGQVRFHHAARAVGIRAITGVELRAGFGARRPGRRAGRLVLLARDEAGYQALCEIVTRRRTTGLDATPDPVASLAVVHPGLFLMSDDVAVLEALLERGHDPANLRHLVVRPGPAGATAPPASVAPVADLDSVLIDPTDRAFHRLLVALHTRRPLDSLEDDAPAARSLAMAADVPGLFADLPAACAETTRIAERCTLDLVARPGVPFRLPRADGSSGVDELARACAERLAGARAASRPRLAGEAYDRRLAGELAVIADSGFADLFLAVAAIAGRARELGLPVSGRGSAVGSLVAHLLDIGADDPLAHGLLFERFLHGERRRPPDLDLDVPSSRRDELLAWAFGHFGEERVAMVAAHQTFGVRAAWREGLKALGLAPAAIERFATALPPGEIGDDPGIPRPLELLPPAVRAQAPLLERLVGRFRHLAVHPGGLLLAHPRVAAHAPLELAPKGVVVVQYDMHALEALGLIKVDILGNRALDALARTRALAGRDHRPIPADDAATLELLRSGRTIGCFQVESPPVRGTLARLPLAHRDDLVAALALVRPGPASGRAREAFIRRAWGEEDPAPPHPRLADVLAETRGLPLFEEQLTRLVARVTGWTIERADALRESVADGAPASDPGHPFMAACLARGMAPDEARGLARTLERFASYTFNKAHAVSQAALAWEAAFSKAHHPLAFACAVLEHYGGQYPKRTLAAELARLVPLRGPHVDHSARVAEPEEGAVRIGLSALNVLSAATRDRLLVARPFRDLADVLTRVAPRPAELEALVLSGALDGLEPLGPGAYPFVHEEALRRLAASPGPAALAGLTTPRSLSTPETDAYRGLVRARNELRFLGMHPSAHPVAILRSEATAAGAVAIAELVGHSGCEVRIAGLVAATRHLATGVGRALQFVTFEDETGVVESVVPPRPYARLAQVVGGPGPHLVHGRVEVDHGVPTLHVREVLPFHLRARPWGRVGAA
jgi:DNA polymerase III alpha subunit